MPMILDTSGTLLANRQIVTSVLPSPQYKNFRCVINNYGPFYRNNHQVYRIQSNGTPLLLTEGIDYVLGHKFVDATTQTHRLIYGSVAIINPAITGSIRIEANYIGGNYELTTQRVIEALANITTNPRDFSWEQLLDIPEAFPPGPHQHAENDFGGIDQIISKLGDMVQAIINRPVSITLQTYNAGITALNARLDSFLSDIGTLATTVAATVSAPLNAAISALANRVTNLETFQSEVTNNFLSQITDTIINSGSFTYNDSVKSKQIIVKTSTTVAWTNEVINKPTLWIPSASCSSFTFQSVGGKAKFTIMNEYNASANSWTNPSSDSVTVDTGAVMTIVQSVSTNDIIVEIHPITKYQ